MSNCESERHGSVGKGCGFFFGGGGWCPGVVNSVVIKGIMPGSAI